MSPLLIADRDSSDWYPEAGKGLVPVTIPNEGLIIQLAGTEGSFNVDCSNDAITGTISPRLPAGPLPVMVDCATGGMLMLINGTGESIDCNLIITDKQGTEGNPYELNVDGENVAVADGWNGEFFSYTATEDCTISIASATCSDSTLYAMIIASYETDYGFTNETIYDLSYEDDAEDTNMSVTLTAGQTIVLCVMEANFSATTVTFTVSVVPAA